jgi:hypothetical protein
VAKSPIETGRLEKRFGRMPSSGGSSRGPDDPRSGDGSSNGNTLFASALVIIFIVGVGALTASNAGAGFRRALLEDIMGPPPEPAYQSRVAVVCDKGWQDYRDNRDQIDCYLTNDIERLCDPRERRALVDKLFAYQIADDRLIGRAAMSFLKGDGKSDPMEIGIAEAKSRDPNLSEDERAAQIKKVTSMADDFTAPTAKTLAEGSENKHGIVTILNDVKSLAEQGYLAASDFTTKPPKIVKEGLAAAHSVAASPCRR